MKIMCRLLAFSLLAFTLLLPLGYAQDYITWGLPEGAKARFGKGAINSLKLSPDGKRLAVGSATGIWLYDTDTGVELALLIGHVTPVTSLTFSADSSILASGSDGEIRLWDVAARQHLKTLKAHKDYVQGLDISADGRTLVSSSRSDRTVQFWEITSGGRLKTFRVVPVGVRGFLSRVFEKRGVITDWTFSLDARLFVIRYQDGTVEMKDAATGRVLKIIKENEGYNLSGIAISADGKTLAIASDKIRLWDVPTGSQLRTLPGNSILEISPNGKTLLVNRPLIQSIEVWNIDTGELRVTINRGRGFSWKFTSSMDFKTIVIGESEGTIRFWDTDTGEQLKIFNSGHEHQVFDLAFSPDGTMLAAGNAVTARVWDAHTGELQFSTFHQLQNPTGTEPRTSSFLDQTNPVLAVTFSPDSTTFTCATGLRDQKDLIGLWDIDCRDLNSETLLRDVPTFTLTEEVDYGLSVNTRGNNRVVFSPDGRTLAAKGQRINLWDTSTGNRHLTLKDIGAMDALAFTPDGKILATVGGWKDNEIWWFDSTIRFWYTATGEQLSTITTSMRPQWMQDFSFFIVNNPWWGESVWGKSLAFSPDGRTLATGSNDGQIQLWEVNTGRKRSTLKGHVGTVDELTFSSNGKFLASGSRDGPIIIRNANTGKRIGTLKGHARGINALTFSPDNQTLASGCGDGVVFLWDVNRFIRP